MMQYSIVALKFDFYLVVTAVIKSLSLLRRGFLFLSSYSDLHNDMPLHSSAHTVIYNDGSKSELLENNKKPLRRRES